MKIVYKNLLLLTLSLLFIHVFTSCEDADDNYIHTDNLIHGMQCWAGRTNAAPYIEGKIIEYDKDGNVLPDGFTLEDAEGGSGVIQFIVPLDDHDKFDLTKVYLRANVTYDEIIYPTLSGLQNILVDKENPYGLVITVKSQINTMRKYRVMGIYAY